MSALPYACFLLFAIVPGPAAQGELSGSSRGLIGHLPFQAPPRGSFLECARLVRTFEGEAAGDQFGWVSSPMPDQDGDGVREVIVSAPFHDAGGNASGPITSQLSP